MRKKGVLILLCLISVIAVGFGQSRTGSDVPRLSDEERRNNSWVDEKWSADDAPFLKMRKDTFADVRSGSGVKATVNRYRKQSLEHPKSACLLMGWAIATYASYLDNPNLWDEKEWVFRFREVIAAVRKFPSPKAREFARTRFRLESHYVNELHGPNKVESGSLLKMGRRLIATGPGDDSVEFCMVSLLNIGNDKPSILEAYAISKRLLQRHPKEPNYMLVAGTQATWLYILTKDPAYEKSARDLLNRAANLAEKGSETYSNAMLRLTTLDKAKKDTGKSKK